MHVDIEKRRKFNRGPVTPKFPGRIWSQSAPTRSYFIILILPHRSQIPTMPVNRIEVEPSEIEANVIPQKSHIKTISGWAGNPSVSVAPEDPPNYTRYRNKMSWWAIVYKSVPDAVGLAGIKYAFNPGEVRWRRYRKGHILT